MLDRDVSGRDLKIISEALYIAIPFMLKHTMSASNTRDMIRIMEYIDKEFRFFSHLKRQELRVVDIKGKSQILKLGNSGVTNMKDLANLESSRKVSLPSKVLNRLKIILMIRSL